MSKLKVGDIILLKPEVGDVVGEMVVSDTDAVFSHAAMVYSDKGDDLRIIELVKDGVSINKMKAKEVGEDKYNGIAMRLKTEFDPDILKKTADHMQKRKIGFDLTGLLILKGFAKVHKHLKFDHDAPQGQEFFLLAAAEFINLMKKINLATKEFSHYEETLHCTQFIYNLFHESGAAYRIELDGGTFLSDFEIDDRLRASNETQDKVDYLSKMLDNKLSEEFLTDWESIKSPIINGKTYKKALGNYRDIMESDIPIASALVTADDLKDHAVNLQQIGYYEISVKR